MKAKLRGHDVADLIVGHRKCGGFKLRHHLSARKFWQFTAIILRAGVFGILFGQCSEVRAAANLLEQIVNLFALGSHGVRRQRRPRGWVNRHQQNVAHMGHFRLFKIRRVLGVKRFGLGIGD